jgi:hypothetical protein
MEIETGGKNEFKNVLLNIVEILIIYIFKYLGDKK